MREILFRAKRNKAYCPSRDWTYGVPFIDHEGDCIFKTSASEFVVDPETVGQYTGLTDKNGKKIFEGDIVRAQDNLITSPFCDGIIGKIVYDECAFFIEPTNPMESQWLFNECADYEVLGNIHDNPELLKGE